MVDSHPSKKIDINSLYVYEDEGRITTDASAIVLVLLIQSRRTNMVWKYWG